MAWDELGDRDAKGVCHLTASLCLQMKYGLRAALFAKCSVPATEAIGIRTLATCIALVLLLSLLSRCRTCLSLFTSTAYLEATSASCHQLATPVQFPVESLPFDIRSKTMLYSFGLCQFTSVTDGARSFPA